MNRYEYNDVTVHAPTGWHELAVSTYDRIWPLKPTTARERVNVVAIACGVELEVLLQWPVEVITMILNDVDFLFKDNPLPATPTVMVGEARYVVAIEEKLSFGEYIDVGDVQKDSDAILSNVLAIVCRPPGEKYDPDNNEQRAIMFGALPVSQVQGVLAFFLACYQTSTQHMRLLGSLQAMADLLPRNTASLLRHGGTIKLFQIWPIIKYGFLMKSLRARLRRYSRSYSIRETSVVMEMPENPSDEKKAQFQTDMEAAFTGTGSTSIVILWGNGSSGEVRPKITPFSASSNADLYNNIEGIIFQKIISAHRLSSPTLAGVSGSGNLSGNAAEIIDAYVLFNYTVINQMRRTILDTLNQFQRINGVADLRIEELDVLPKIMETTNPDKIATPAGDDGGDVMSSLASEIGVGGVQALTAIMENPNLPEPQKRELLSVLFGLDESVLERLFAPKTATLQRKSRIGSWFKKMLSKYK